MPEISTSQTSPSFIHSLGVRPAPTPAGVPVTITSPALRVMKLEQTETICATENTMSSIIAFWTTLPFSRVVSSSPTQPFGSASAVTNTGPKAPLSSKFLPGVHCGALNW